MGSRAALWTTIIGALTAVLGLVTAVIVLMATLGSNQLGGPSTPATPPPGTTPPAVASSSAAPSSSHVAAASPSASRADPASPLPSGAAPSTTAAPTAAPTAPPSVSATAAPTPAPTAVPSAAPTPAPTKAVAVREILFYSVRDDRARGAANADLYAVDPVTGSERRLTEHGEPDSDPVWSPDGTRIAFDSRLDGGTRDIWILEADGSLLRITDDETDDAFPTWSPDGELLAWSRGSGSEREIWVASARDGSDSHFVTTGSDDRAPSWSSRGLIAFERRSGSRSEIWVVEPDVSGPVARITTADGGGANPAWSPDARRIAFVRAVDGLNRVFNVASDGVSGLVEVTRGLACDCEFPTWSPDGTQIAYVGPRGTARPILIVDASGGRARRITTNGLVPSWGD